MIEQKDCYVYQKCKKAICGKCNHANESFCQRLFRIDRLYDESLLSKKQRVRIDLRLDEDGTDREEFIALKAIENNIESFVADGESLYIHSCICGNSKTSWAIRLIQAYIERIWYKSDITCRALFISVPRFLLALKENISSPSEYVNHIKENIYECDIVVWDEIGTKAPTQFEAEHLLSLINARIDEGKTNIYTSNLGSEQLREMVGERLYSRIINLSTDIEFHGQDKRGIKNDK